MTKQAVTKKEETRKRMIDAAGRSFRQFGFAGIGVDGIAKAAGVTSGAFYAHLGSKDAAFEMAVEAGLDEVIAAIPQFQTVYGGDWVDAFSDYYLGRSHREDLANGCAMATLTPEVVKAGADQQASYEVKMTRIAKLVAQGLVGSTEEESMTRAWAMLSVLIGGLNVARAMGNSIVAEEIADAVKKAAVRIAGKTR
ncbi:MAG: TetR/AcrR family transcriptional regulator [Alphaproteobacteria bacterium]|nr:TetR/AcrR family transcriptional regulator [Alphaproteobacteria bacterium]